MKRPVSRKERRSGVQSPVARKERRAGVQPLARPLPSTYWVLPGRLLAGEHPGGETRSQTRARLKALFAAGIDSFLDLTMPHELDAYDAELPADAPYRREAIQDHSVPAAREQMIRIIDWLESALKAGRHPYVHCRAGIGRTGTVIGCLLAERGRSGDEALRELNQLWHACSRAKVWPFVPETDEQVEFVRNWTRRIPDAPALTAGAQDLRERYLGALVGLAVGDALAVATQGATPGKFTPITDVAGGGPFALPRGAWSDDTAMALCLAESLIERDGFDARDQTQRYTRWQQQGHLSATGEAVGITASTGRALGLARWQRKLFSGSHDPAQLDPEPLSRVAPAVMFFYGSPQVAVHQGCEAARTTCQAPIVLECCRLFAAFLHGALAGRSKSGIFKPGAEILDIGRLRPAIAALANDKDEPKAAVAGKRVDTALQAALWAFKSTDNFRAGALRCANLGGSSDVITAVYGQLAGAHYGWSAIPIDWRNSLIHNSLIVRFAERLLACAQLG
ncbi:MAG TPA: ADP-ribosylglycohydrolase family protein [Steroidobacteraceae bacterium]